MTGFSIQAQEVELKGSLTQGGLVIGHLGDLTNVSLNGKTLRHTKDGYFVFGFARDAAPTAELNWTDRNGQSYSKVIKVAQREFKIDRVNGVEKKYVSPPEAVLERIRNDSKKVTEARSGFSEKRFFLDPFYQPAEGRISGVYGSQRVFNGVPKNPHYGLDIANKIGTHVYAPASGTVVLAEPDLYYSGGTVIIDHGFGVTSTYLHLSKLHVKAGDEVTTGKHFADIGATGRVTGPHLDWRLNWFNERLDPALIMKETLAVKEAKNDVKR
ncbi:M23 family metallopeptidase [Pseudoalteromonas xiamenensis]|nr:M23 family metallopeptidase [Pseudoalteromonas xiamenensis]WMN61526.1 M23 family metallopeptidase [Pseudoalteromonas xiamenensis]